MLLEYFNGSIQNWTGTLQSSVACATYYTIEPLQYASLYISNNIKTCCMHIYLLFTPVPGIEPRSAEGESDILLPLYYTGISWYKFIPRIR